MRVAIADVVGVDLGRRLMRNRKPINVKNFSQLHNLIMFFLSLYMVIETVTQVSFSGWHALHLVCLAMRLPARGCVQFVQLVKNLVSFIDCLPHVVAV